MGEWRRRYRRGSVNCPPAPTAVHTEKSPYVIWGLYLFKCETVHGSWEEFKTGVFT